MRKGERDNPQSIKTKQHFEIILEKIWWSFDKKSSRKQQEWRHFEFKTPLKQEKL